MSSMTAKVAPGPVDYVAAIQHPTEAFSDPELRLAVFETDIFGMPAVATGSNAVVFKARVGKQAEALRCYTNISAPNLERYQALTAHVREHELACVANADLFPHAIAVNGEKWPVLRMEWVAGRALDRYVNYLVEQGNPQAVARLAQDWRALAQQLEAAAFAHGDLQHGNVMIDDSCRLRLVDLDGVWLPALAGSSPPREVGHCNYQHPSRRSTPSWDRWVDSFSALVIYVSLTAIAADPTLWAEFHDGDNLIFKCADFNHPLETRVWGRLAAVRDPQVRKLARVLQECCVPIWSEQTTLERLVSERPSWKSSQAGGVEHDRALPDLPWAVELAGRPVLTTQLPKPPPVSAEATVMASGPSARGPQPPPGSAPWWFHMPPVGPPLDIPPQASSWLGPHRPPGPPSGPPTAPKKPAATPKKPARTPKKAAATPKKPAATPKKPAATPAAKAPGAVDAGARREHFKRLARVWALVTLAGAGASVFVNAFLVVTVVTLVVTVIMLLRFFTWNARSRR